MLGPDLAHDALARLSLVRIRDFMLPSLGPAIAQLNLLKPLLRRVDPKIYQRLKLIESHFALAAVLTLYSHDIDEYAAIVRLFDVFLAKEAVFPIYLFASIILGSRELILDLPEDEPEMLHVTLSKLPKPTDLEDTIRQACVLLQSHPPQSLSTWRQISSYSTLRTCRLPLDWTLIRLQEAERLLALQHEEFNRQVRDQKLTRQLVQYRRLVIFAGLTVVIGLVAVWVGPEGLRTRMKALWVYF